MNSLVVNHADGSPVAIANIRSMVWECSYCDRILITNRMPDRCECGGNFRGIGIYVGPAGEAGTAVKFSRLGYVFGAQTDPDVALSELVRDLQGDEPDKPEVCAAR